MLNRQLAKINTLTLYRWVLCVLLNATLPSYEVILELVILVLYMVNKWRQRLGPSMCVRYTINYFQSTLDSLGAYILI